MLRLDEALHSSRSYGLKRPTTRSVKCDFRRKDFRITVSADGDAFLVNDSQLPRSMEGSVEPEHSRILECFGSTQPSIPCGNTASSTKQLTS